ncbi:RagB/SusD family nutrient uptake outer membrane protein [Flavihumibacter sp. UBA7668]|uniref:RagB/SusD family nutrient uptake outer membrane protein n=1 Tax=Flavihumibacter sp. UBA7668 TaxID=1946542 RepID=UPI0025BB18DB|nr:RagB/SusD family nutrient uptake outer membrane protein [Flavihumibacter sp. UBA7668]
MKYIILFILSLFLLSCSKFLNEKPDEKLSAINSLEDCQAILDRNLYVSKFGIGAMESSSDNFYLNPDFWNQISEENRNMYQWAPENIFTTYGLTGNEWSYCYDNIFRANTVLEEVEKFKQGGLEYGNIKGQAYFIRAHHYLQAAWTWALAYEKTSASSKLGLPLRTGTNFNEEVGRSDLEQTYQQIILDTRKAIDLLPTLPMHVFRPSKPAAIALLARVFLSMNQYDSCYKYAEMAWSLRSDLLDFNNQLEVDTSVVKPFQNFNKEVIFEYASLLELTNQQYSFIDTNLVASYSLHDIRKPAFFIRLGNQFTFKGSYNNGYNFAGITAAEVLLMKIEAAARLNRSTEAVEGLNLLLKHRIKTDQFSPYLFSTTQQLIADILMERRKELLMRGLRFMDIKRLNVLGAGIILKRIVNDMEVLLLPNDLRYALAIPEDVIAISRIVQNPR